MNSVRDSRATCCRASCSSALAFAIPSAAPLVARRLSGCGAEGVRQAAPGCGHMKDRVQYKRRKPFFSYGDDKIKQTGEIASSCRKLQCQYGGRRGAVQEGCARSIAQCLPRHQPLLMQDVEWQPRVIRRLITTQGIGCAAVAHHSHMPADSELLARCIEVPAQFGRAAALQL